MTNAFAKKPNCAILLAAFNGEKWIKEQIHSILDQSEVDIKLFISIDKSSDTTLDICQELSKSDCRVQILPYGDRYGSPAKNFFRLIKDIQLENFDIFALSDQDDIWLEDKIVNAWKKISECNFDVYSSNVIAFWENGKKKVLKKSFPQTEYDHFFEAAGCGCTYVFSKNVFVEMQNFLIKNYDKCLKVTLHDWLFYAFCRESNYKWFIDKTPRMLYRQHSNNQVGANFTIKSYMKRFNLIRSKWYKEQINIIYKLFYPYQKNITDVKFIIKNFNKIRRRPRDQFIMLILAMLGVF
jgi:rhamnosyltransferase